MTALRQDLTYAFRRLSKSPGFAAAAAISIALGIGANATVFSMVSRFILRPPPVGDPGTLMALHTTQHGECCNQFTWPLFADLRDQSRSFSGLAAYYELIPASIGGNGDPERLWGQATTTHAGQKAWIPSRRCVMSSARIDCLPPTGKVGAA